MRPGLWLLGVVLVVTGCAGGDASSRRGALQQRAGVAEWRRSPLMEEPSLGGPPTRRDAFDVLLGNAGLDERDALPVAGSALTPRHAVRLLRTLLEKDVTLGQFPARVALGFVLREVLATGEVSRAALARRVERFRYMTRGEQVQAVSRLVTNLVATWGTVSAGTRTLQGTAFATAEVPVLALAADGTVALRMVAAPVGRAAAVLSGGPGAAIILHRAGTAAKDGAPSKGPGQWGPAKESMSPSARRYQEQISGHSADEAYWVGGVGRDSGGVKFDGFEKGVLLEAKGPGYANKFLDNLKPRIWFENSGAKALVEQAQRQLAKTPADVPIKWFIAEEKTADAIRVLFQRERIIGIEVLHVPPL